MATNEPRRRVLLINYYWPPSGGVGVLRTLKFAKFLRNYGWEPVIYTALNPAYPSIDPGNEQDIPPNVEVIRRPILEPHGIYAKLRGKKKDKQTDVLYVPDGQAGWLQRLSLWARANLFIPDARALWIKPSVSYLKQYLRENPVEVILSSGPPHTNTRIAYHLKRELGIPWIADWRDPWTQADYFGGLPLTSWGRGRHRRMEKECLENSDRTLIVSHHWAEDLRRIGGQNVHVLTNGFDRDDLANIEAVEEVGKFSLTHLGILGPDRIPQTFIDVIGQLNKEIPGFRDTFRLRLIGQVTPLFREKTREAGWAEEQLEVREQMPRKDALGYAAGSQMNLLLLNQRENAAGRIPFKLFEYLALAKPILAFGPRESDVGSILRQTGSDILAYEDKVLIETVLRKNYAAFTAGTTGFGSLNIDQLEAYSFKSITARLAEHLNAIT